MNDDLIDYSRLTVFTGKDRRAADEERRKRLQLQLPHRRPLLPKRPARPTLIDSFGSEQPGRAA